jgi:hypothetical protein
VQDVGELFSRQANPKERNMERLLITTAIGLMLGTGAFAQSPSEQPRSNAPAAAHSNSPAAAQSQTNSNSSMPSSNSSAPSPSSSTSSSPSSTPSAQNAQSTPSGAAKSPTTTSQSAPNASGNNDPARSQAQSNQASPPSQAQSSQPSSSSNQAQTNTAPPTNNQSQPSPAGANANTNAGAQPSTNTAAQPSTNTAAQPSNNQTNTAQSRSSNISVSANLNESQRTRVSASIARLNVAPVNNVNFSLSVGTVVPRDVRFQPLPADVVEVMPQYRGYDFLVVRDDIVIVEPSTYKIVDVLPRAGRSTAAAPAPRKTTFSDRDREVIRKHARSRTEQRTTGSATSTRVRVGDRLPDSVEIRSFPDEVYRESPTLREYRYIERDSRTYLIEPHERTIIEEID